MRRRWHVAAAAAVALTLVGTPVPPASAAGTGDGDHVGLIGNIAPGITLTNRPQTFTVTTSFADARMTVTNGVNTATYIGLVTFSEIKGQSPGESCAIGSGTIDPTTIAGITHVGNVEMRFSSVVAGAYTRVGEKVVFNLDGFARITTLSSTPAFTSEVQGNVKMTMHWWITPTVGDCITTPITEAEDVGVWKMVQT